MKLNSLKPEKIKLCYLLGISSKLDVKSLWLQVFSDLIRFQI